MTGLDDNQIIRSKGKGDGSGDGEPQRNPHYTHQDVKADQSGEHHAGPVKVDRLNRFFQIEKVFGCCSFHRNVIRGHTGEHGSGPRDYVTVFGLGRMLVELFRHA